MKKKRYLPFGYQMNEGNIIPDILESSAVQSIFENYRNGASLQMLAKQMQQSGLKYRENAVWNKAMIARILDCEKYISEEKGVLSGGVAFYVGNAMVALGVGPQEIAEKVSRNTRSYLLPDLRTEACSNQSSR